MNFKREIYILTGVAAVLSLVYVVGIVTAPGARAAREQRRTALPVIERSVVAAIEINHGETVLQREGDADVWWLVGTENERLPARAERVDAVIDALSDLEVRRTVTSNRNRHVALGFDQPMSVVVTDRSGNATLDLEVGSVVSGASTVYARLRGSDTVVELRGNLSFYLSRDTTYWTDRRLVRDTFDAASAVRLVYQYGEQRVELNKSADVAAGSRAAWRLQVDADPPVDVEASPVIAHLRSLLATEAVEIRSVSVLRGATVPFQPAWTLELRFSDGGMVAWQAVPTREFDEADTSGDVWLRTSAGIDGYLYRIRADRVDSLVPAPSRFVAQ